jgi:TnpA family transposase
LDGLLMNEAGRKISEQYADTGGFTDQVFAVTALLSYRFIPRIRDLPSTRLYLLDPATAPNELRGLIGSKIREGVIVQNWPGVLRAVATMATGVLPPSQPLKKFAAYPPIRASTSWPWRSAKSVASNAPSSSSSGYSMPTCSAGLRSD